MATEIFFQPPDAGQQGRKPLGIGFKIGIGLVQGLQNQVRRTGGAKEHQGVFALGYGKPLRQVQIRAAGEHRKGLMGRVTADVRPQIHGMPGRMQKFQVCPVGIVHSQEYPVAVADLCQRGDVRKIPQIVGTGQVKGRGSLFFQVVFQFLRCQRAGEVAGLLFRVQPGDLHAQKGRGGQEGLMGIAPGGNPGFLPLLPGSLAQQVHHGPDTLGGAFRGIEGGTAEKRGGVFLTLGDDAVGFVKTVGTPDLCDIQGFQSQGALSLMARHMQPQGLIFQIAGDKVADGGIHLTLPGPGQWPP